MAEENEIKAFLIKLKILLNEDKFKDILFLVETVSNYFDENLSVAEIGKNSYTHNYLMKEAPCKIPLYIPRRLLHRAAL